MVRSYWIGPVMLGLAVTGLAWSQTNPPVPSSVESKERTLTVQEANRPAQKCKLLKSWRLPDGHKAYLVQSLASSEYITIVEMTDNSGVAKAAVTKIYHWGESQKPPLGAPEVPNNALVLGTPLNLTSTSGFLAPAIPTTVVQENKPKTATTAANKGALLPLAIATKQSDSKASGQLDGTSAPKALAQDISKPMITTALPPTKASGQPIGSSTPTPVAQDNSKLKTTTALPPTKASALLVGTSAPTPVAQDISKPMSAIAPPTKAPEQPIGTSAPKPLTQDTGKPMTTSALPANKAPGLPVGTSAPIPLAQDTGKPLTATAPTASKATAQIVGPSAPSSSADAGKVAAATPTQKVKDLNYLMPTTPMPTLRSATGAKPLQPESVVAKKPDDKSPRLQSSAALDAKPTQVSLPVTQENGAPQTADWRTSWGKTDTAQNKPSPIPTPTTAAITSQAPIRTNAAPPLVPENKPVDAKANLQLISNKTAALDLPPSLPSSKSVPMTPTLPSAENKAAPLTLGMESVKAAVEAPPPSAHMESADIGNAFTALPAPQKVVDAALPQVGTRAQMTQKWTFPDMGTTQQPLQMQKWTFPDTATTQQTIQMQNCTFPDTMATQRTIQTQKWTFPDTAATPQLAEAMPQPGKGPMIGAPLIYQPTRMDQGNSPALDNAFTATSTTRPIPANFGPPATVPNAFHDGNTGPVAYVMPAPASPYPANPEAVAKMDHGAPMEAVAVSKPAPPRTSDFPLVAKADRGAASERVTVSGTAPQGASNPQAVAKVDHDPASERVTVSITAPRGTSNLQTVAKMDRGPVSEQGIASSPAPQAAGSTSHLLAILKESLYPSQRESAAQSLAGRDWHQQPQIVDALVKAAKEDPAPMVRAECVRSLACLKVNTVPVVVACQSLKSDTDARVRKEAEQALLALAATVPAKGAPSVRPVSATQPK